MYKIFFNFIIELKCKEAISLNITSKAPNIITKTSQRWRLQHLNKKAWSKHIILKWKQCPFSTRVKSYKDDRSNNQSEEDSTFSIINRYLLWDLKQRITPAWRLNLRKLFGMQIDLASLNSLQWSQRNNLRLTTYPTLR